MDPVIKKVYIESRIRDGQLVRNLKKNLPSTCEFIEIESAEEFRLENREGAGGTRKDTLLVQHYPGSFLTSCPGSDGVVCCNYFVIDTGPGCIYDCHYCFLQTFMNTSVISLYGNTEDIFAELDRKIQGKKGQFRIGTGEYTDSLALDPWTGFSASLVEWFARSPNATLELKTKSDHVDHLLSLDHRERTVISWSINPQGIVNSIEEGAAPLERRLEAARKAQDAGYPIAFHLDPIFYYPDWKKDYGDLLQQTFQTVGTDRIAWISMGGFRYSPGLPEIVHHRFGNDWIVHGEMIQGKDGKYRYFKTIREEIYRAIREMVNEADPSLFLYMCMDTKHMWNRIYSGVPDSPRMLDAGFEARLDSIRKKNKGR